MFAWHIFVAGMEIKDTNGNESKNLNKKFSGP